MREKYKKAPMVSWFDPGMLFQAAMKATISSLFGNYADRREMEAALDSSAAQAENDLAEVYEKLNDKGEVWFDFISDTGDGFNPTYSVAVTAAADQLQVKTEEGDLTLPRGTFLFLGGDQVYPTPSVELYDQKFRTPFEAAFPKKANDNDGAHMFAIPGNHDWYDGLGAFLKLFCQKRWTGNWATHQRRSYWAVPLLHNYWMWAIDVQLNSDIDEPQKQYFKEVAINKMQKNDKVVLITAEPSWVYHQLYPDSKSYERLQFFIQTYITEDKSECIGKTFDLVAVLTGDLHHYSHYCSSDSDTPLHYLGAGGGGAFLHLTHNLPERLTEVEKINEKEVIQLRKSDAEMKNRLKETNIKRQTIFPEKRTSQGLIILNLLFFLKNIGFSVFMGLLYLVTHWFIQSSTYDTNNGTYMQRISKKGLGDFLDITGSVLLHTPSAFLLLGLFVVACRGFAKLPPSKMKMGWWGLLHGLFHCVCIFLSFWALTFWHDYAPTVGHSFSWEKALIAVEIFLIGFLVGGMIMGLYLVLSNLIFDFHIDEASTALRYEHYKCFLRMHLTKDGLRIYPIGVRQVTKNWQVEQEGENIRFKGPPPAYELIGGKPIVIPNAKAVS
jgi:hypothetical protein